jgi:hypothetical protein
MQQVYRRICVDPFPDVSLKLATISPQCKAILERCVKRDPKERFADCRDLVRELSKIVVKDPPASNLADAESGTMRVPPLLSPPPADTLGHIRVALQDVADNTVRVRTPTPAGQGRGSASPARAEPPMPTPAPAAPVASPPAQAPAEVPAPRRKTAVLMGVIGGVAVVGLLSWFVIEQLLHPGQTNAANTPVIPTPAAHVLLSLAAETPDVVYVGASGDPVLSGTAENATSTEVWLADEHGERLGKATLVGGSFALHLHDFPALSEGRHSMRVLTNDAQDKTIQVICDRTEPKITAIGFSEVSKETKNVLHFAVHDDNPGDAVPTVDADGTTAGATERVKGSDGEWQAEFTLPDGPHLLTVSAQDRAGNVGKASFPLQVETSKPIPPPILSVPVQKIVVKADDPSPDTRTLSGSVSDAVANGLSHVWIEDGDGKHLSTAELKEGGAFDLPLSFLAKLPDGTHSFQIKADKGDAVPLSVDCDRVRPGITPLDHGGLTKERPYVLRFQVAEPVDSAWVEVVHPPSAAMKCDAHKQGDGWQAQIPGEDGKSTLTIHAKDSVGNEGQYPAGPEEALELDVDTKAPGVERVEPSGRLVPEQKKVTLYLSEEVAAYQIAGQPRVDLGSEAKNEIEVPCAIPIDQKSFSITGSLWDRAGNEGSIGATFEVDTELVCPKGWKSEPSEPFLELDATGQVAVRRATRVTDPKTGVTFRLLPDLKPPIYIAETELTVAQFKNWPDSTIKDGQEEDLPVTGINWITASKYCKYFDYDLPTPEEWRAACLAGSPGQYPRGVDASNLPQYAWYAWRKKKDLPEAPLTPQPVGKRTATGVGLYDMLGNVWELCQGMVKLGGSYLTPADRCVAEYSDRAAGTEGTRDTGFRPVKRILD